MDHSLRTRDKVAQRMRVRKVTQNPFNASVFVIARAPDQCIRWLVAVHGFIENCLPDKAGCSRYRYGYVAAHSSTI
jgi:hypothetical protein